MKGHIYIPRTGDMDFIQEKIEYFRKMDNAELLLEAEKKRKQGFFGVHHQALHLIAFHQVMLERFNDSPLVIKDNCLLKFKENEQP